MDILPVKLVFYDFVYNYIIKPVSNKFYCVTTNTTVYVMMKTYTTQKSDHVNNKLACGFVTMCARILKNPRDDQPHLY